VNQTILDRMAALRRQGLTFRDIAEQVGCSERTARRYAGQVRPELRLPQARPERATDPRALRDQLLREFVDLLYRDRLLRSLTVTWHQVGEDTWDPEYGGPPSTLFLSEAERLLRERLEAIGPLALRLLTEDARSKPRFIREVIGKLYRDYVAWHRFSQNLGGPFPTGEHWRPPRRLHGPGLP
jgi:hypothetical protein